MTDRPKRRALLIASIGVATVSYVAACEHPAAGNLAPPQPAMDAGPSPVSGNLAPPMGTDVAPVATGHPDAGSVSVPVDVSPTAGNLMVQAPTASASASAKPKPPKPPSRPPTSPVGGNLAPPR